MRKAVSAVFWCIALSGALPSGAQNALSNQDFTFKRVTAPPPGQFGKIDVQIDPEEQARRLAPPQALSRPDAGNKPSPSEPEGANVGDYPWFWRAISPLLRDSGPGRLERAVAALSGQSAGQAVSSPRLESIQKVVGRHGQDLLAATVGTRVSPALALAVVMVESGGSERAVSSAGAQGLMQLIPATAERFGVADANVAAENIRGGVAYLDWLMEEFDGDPIMVLAAYNAGENAVRKAGGVPPFRETRNYVPRVLAAWKVARGLCLTPPELISDGCVFGVQEARRDD